MRRREFLRTAAVGGSSVALLTADGVSARKPYRPLGSVAIENAKEAVVGNDGKTAFVAATDGFATVDIQNPANPAKLTERRDLLADRAGGPLSQIWDVKVDGDRLLVAGPANPVEGDVPHGFLLYDVSDPSKPKRVAFHETEFPIHNAMLTDEMAYLTGNDGDGNPLVLVDVSDDDPEEVGRWSMLDVDSDWSDVDSWVRSLHDVWVQDGMAYLAQWDAGTWLVDVSNPTNPSYVTHIGGRSIDELASVPSERDAVLGLPGNDHYVRTNEDGSLLVVNKEAWDTDGAGGNGPGGMELWDVSNLEDPTKLSEIAAPKSADPSYDIGGSGAVSALSGLSSRISELSSSLSELSPVGVASAHGKCHDCTGGAGASGQWTTSHNFDIVGDRLYTTWYQGGVKLFDISDPSNPRELAWWRDPAKAAFWSAQHVSSDFFVAGSMGRHGDGKGGLYTFPNRAGQQENPPTLTAGDNGTDGAISAPKNSTTTITTESSTKQPGFGVGVAGLSVLGFSAWKRLRNRE
ncbi:LVIVD repeat-containing protein [Haladaptatus sp. NG-SE-30]